MAAEPRQSRILVVEDNPSLNEILCRIVETEGYAAVPAHTGALALRALHERGTFDLVLLDVMLPDPSAPMGAGIDGLEVCRRIKSDPILSDILIFLVTVKDQAEDIMRGVDAGADDYITKPFNTVLLLAKIKAMLRIKHLQDELKQKNRQLEEMAVTDGLTGISNHRHFVDRLTDEVKRSRRYGTPIAVLLLDLDGFKEINDTYGHRHGDFVLGEVARRLRVGLRETDMLARYGGDEFALLLPQTDLAGGRRVAEQIIERFNEPLEANARSHIVRVSIGLVAYGGDGDADADRVIVAADTALYRAKELGGNQVYSPPEALS